MVETENSKTTPVTEADVIVLGVGTCGEDLSLRLLDAGLDVVGIEAELVGGECAYWACLPSKMMLRAAKLVKEAHRIEGLAGRAEVHPDWKPVADRVRRGTGDWDDSAAVQRYRDRGGRLVRGRGVIRDARSVEVNGEVFTGRRALVIATGSTPFIPPVSGLADGNHWTSHDVISADEVPESLLVLGGGAVGCELGQVMARFGAAVTIVEANEHLLVGEEPETAELIKTALVADGIDVRTGELASRVQSRDDGSVVVTLADGDVLTAQRLLVATGRRVDLRGLGLDAIGLDESAPHIEVDEYMRVTDGVWAMGDVTGVSMFTHVALYQSAIIAAELLGQDYEPARYDAIPRAIFTDPEVGAVGMTEDEAHEAGLDVEIVIKELPATFRGWVSAAEIGLFKLIIESHSRTLIGATAVGPEAGETLGFLSLAVHNNASLGELQRMIYAFPTFYGGLGEAIGAYGRGLTTVMDPEFSPPEGEMSRVEPGEDRENAPFDVSGDQASQ